MAECSICNKTTTVSLYIRVKPIWQTQEGKMRGAPGKEHKFFGYWPPESHLVEYFKLEKIRNQLILHNYWLTNCRGHSFDVLVEAIENMLPPIPGVPIKILWNPSPKVTPYLLAETQRERDEARLQINNDLRTIIVSERANIKASLKFLFNNAEKEITQKVSYPNSNGLKPLVLDSIL